MSATLDRERLARVLGMLGSDHDGEVVAAARQAERLRREAGITWPDLLTPTLPRHRSEREIADNYAAVCFCQGFAGCLTLWERDFIASISRRPDRLTDKQHNVLVRLVAKCRVAERATA